MYERLEKQAAALHHLVAELMKKYQFRHRQEICCHGISITQYYALAALGETGKLSMGELARQMRLNVSTMTRIVDQLVAKSLVHRWMDPQDHRVCDVALTQQGRSLLGEITGELLETEKAILCCIHPEERETLIVALRELSRAVDQWLALARQKEGVTP